MKQLTRIAFPLLIGAVIACGSVPQTGGHSVGRITYSVSGGFTGWERMLTIEPNGKARIDVVHGPSPGVTERQVDATVLKRLHELVSRPDFAALKPEYLPAPGGADLQDYVITAELDGKTFQTMTRDGAERPQVLGDVITILNGILTA
jgi:hypothetical protein